MSAFLAIFVIGLAYLLGSICSAVIVCRLYSLPDPRTEGSRNAGATNVLRLAGKKYAIIVMIGDVLKGVVPVLLAKLLGVGPFVLGLTCIAAVLGHMYPVFFGFKGGKGVATTIGALLALDFLLGVTVIAIWLLVANLTRYSSLASIISMSLAPLISLPLLRSADIMAALFVIAMFILFQHRNNITRLIDGEEPKIKFKRNSLKDEVTAAFKEGIEEETLFPHDELEPVKTAPKKRKKKTDNPS